MRKNYLLDYQMIYVCFDTDKISIINNFYKDNESVEGLRDFFVECAYYNSGRSYNISIYKGNYHISLSDRCGAERLAHKLSDAVTNGSFDIYFIYDDIHSPPKYMDAKNSFGYSISKNRVRFLERSFIDKSFWHMV